jgi:hypothetical protein
MELERPSFPGMTGLDARRPDAVVGIDDLLTDLKSTLASVVPNGLGLMRARALAE